MQIIWVWLNAVVICMLKDTSSAENPYIASLRDKTNDKINNAHHEFKYVETEGGKGYDLFSYDENSFRDEKWRFDAETGSPTYRLRYAFRDGAQSPFHVNDAISDGTGFHYKSYISNNDITDLLAQRVNEPKIMRALVTAGPISISKQSNFAQPSKQISSQTSHKSGNPGNTKQSTTTSVVNNIPGSNNLLVIQSSTPLTPPISQPTKLTTLTVPGDLFSNVDIAKLSVIKAKLPVLSDAEILQQIVDRLGDLDQEIDPKVLKSLTG